jgi:hypothetical protein
MEKQSCIRGTNLILLVGTINFVATKTKNLLGLAVTRDDP